MRFVSNKQRRTSRSHSLRGRQPVFERLENRIVLASDLGVAMPAVCDLPEISDQCMVATQDYGHQADDSIEDVTAIALPADDSETNPDSKLSDYSGHHELPDDPIYFQMQGDDQLNFEWSLEVEQDVDRFVFSADSDSSASIELRELTGIDDLDLQVEVTDGLGNSIARGSTNEMVELQFEAIEDEIYWVIVDEASGQVVDYSVSLSTQQIGAGDNQVADEMTVECAADADCTESEPSDDCDLPVPDQPEANSDVEDSCATDGASDVEPDNGIDHVSEEGISEDTSADPAGNGDECEIVEPNLDDKTANSDDRPVDQTSVADESLTDVAVEQIDSEPTEPITSDELPGDPNVGAAAETGECAIADEPEVTADEPIESTADNDSTMVHQSQFVSNFGNYFSFDTVNVIGMTNSNQLISGESSESAVSITAPINQGTIADVDDRSYTMEFRDLRITEDAEPLAENDFNSDQLAAIDRVFFDWPSLDIFG